jgi:CBS domain-containing protein
MLVRHYMTAPVMTLTEDISCRSALQHFKRRGFRHAPVVRGSRVVGMISERDLLRILPGALLEQGSARGEVAEQTLVGQIMSLEPLTTHPDAHLEDVARTLVERKIGGLPVIADGALAGIITETDLCRAFVQFATAADSARFTVIPPPIAGGGVQVEQAPLACLRLGLQLVTLLRHEGVNGDPLLLLRVRGARWHELGEALADLGYGIVEIAPPALDRDVA